MPVSFRCHRVSVVTLPFHFLIWRWGTVLGLRSECLLCLESNPELADIPSFWPGICHVKTASASSTDTNPDFLNPVFPVHAISSLCKPIPAYSDFYHEQLMSIRFFTCDLMTSVSPCYGTLAWLGLTYQLTNCLFQGHRQKKYVHWQSLVPLTRMHHGYGHGFCAPLCSE